MSGTSARIAGHAAARLSDPKSAQACEWSDPVQLQRTAAWIGKVPRRSHRGCASMAASPCGGIDMPSSSTPAGPGGTTSNPAISGSGSGMGAGAGVVDGVQAGTVNDAAQGARAGSGADPSLGSGALVPERGNRMGDAATGGAPGMGSAPLGIGAAPQEPPGFPYKVIPPSSQGR
jgi:hypothetical protein